MRHIRTYSQMSSLLESEKSEGNVAEVLKDTQSEVRKMVADLEGQGVSTKGDAAKAEILKAILMADFDLEKAKERIAESAKWWGLGTRRSVGMAVNESGDGAAGALIEILEASEIGHHFKEKYGKTWWGKALGWVVKAVKLPMNLIKWLVQWVARKLGASFEGAQVASNIVLGILALVFLYLAAKVAWPVVSAILAGGFSMSSLVALFKAVFSGGISLGAIKSAVIVPIKALSSSLSLKHHSEDIAHEVGDEVRTVNDLLDAIDRDRKEGRGLRPETKDKWDLENWVKKDHKLHSSIISRLFSIVETFHRDPSYDSKTPIKKLLDRVEDGKIREKLRGLLSDYITTRMTSKRPAGNAPKKRLRFLRRS